MAISVQRADAIWKRRRPIRLAKPEWLRVLVVDDDYDDYLIIERLLRKSGRREIELCHIDNVPDALDALRSRVFDAALLDFFIGNRCGIEVVEALRDEHIEIPVIVLTGSQNSVSERMALDAGAFDFLDKNEVSYALLTRSIDFAVKRFGVEAKLRESENRLRGAREEAVSANRSKSEFLAHMSHELRTPLNAIIGFSQMLRDDVLSLGIDNKYQEYADTICMSGEHLLSLINNLLDLSKIEAGRYDLTIVPNDIAGIFAAVSGLLIPAARAKNVTIQCDVQDGFSALYADERALKQMILNLGSNAVKFSQSEGSVTLRAREDAAHCYIEIADTGVGIDEKEIDAALSPFEQTTAAKKCQAGGTGLGLPITKLLAERHNGSLTMRSEPGCGTTVTLSFPKSTYALVAAS